MMEELTIKAKNVSGKTLKPGTLIYKVEENKFLSWLTKIGIRTIRVKEATANDYKDKEWFIAKNKNEVTKGYSVIGVDTSEFSVGDTIYISDAKTGMYAITPTESLTNASAKINYTLKD